MRARRLVLTYHSHNIGGNDYESNDHVALAADLRTLAACRAQIVSLDRIADAQRRRDWPDAGRLEVAITFDDGPRFDVSDFEHRQWGPQKSFRRILSEAAPFFKHSGSPPARRAS